MNLDARFSTLDGKVSFANSIDSQHGIKVPSINHENPISLWKYQTSIPGITLTRDVSSPRTMTFSNSSQVISQPRPSVVELSFLLESKPAAGFSTRRFFRFHRESQRRNTHRHRYRNTSGYYYGYWIHVRGLGRAASSRELNERSDAACTTATGTTPRHAK